MNEQYYHTPEKAPIPGLTFQAGYDAGLDSISPVGPFELGLGFPSGRYAGDQHQTFQFQIGPSS
jgi:outer membrane protein assembly factor BamA